MPGELLPAPSQPRATHGWFLLGCLLAAVPLAGLAEGYLRFFPPKDLHAYLGTASPLSGPYRPDDAFSVGYRSWDAFAADNAERLRPFLPLTGHPDPRPVWAFFGNSFVQAPGMLGDTAAAQVRDRRTFHLGRNEHLCLRLAQIATLLENGLQPERVFVEMMPVDLLTLGEQPLASMRVTGRGALTYEPRPLPGPAGWLTAHSRLALTAQVRAGRHRGNPRFRGKRLYDEIDPTLYADLDRLFGNLARVTRAKQVPVTVLFIPTYHQILHGVGFAFQDTLGTLFRRHGLDVCDPREAFLRFPDGPGLYLPDKHLTPAGNALLLDELLRHVRSTDYLVSRGGAAGEP